MAALAACLDTSGLGDDVHAAAVALWEQNGPASYSMQVTRTCVCEGPTGPVLVEVQNRVIVSWTDPDTGEPLEAQLQSGYPDVPGLFALIEQVKRQNPAFFQAKYDPTYGFPTIITINVTPSRVDDDLEYAVTEFTPLN